MATKSPKPIRAFISYSHRDEKFLERLQTHLSSLKREGMISAWYDRELPVGTEWRAEIDQRLKSADVILLLVSADFLASDYCYDVELKRALEMHDAGEAVVIPIIVRPCDWHSAPFGKLQALPRDGKPISSFADVDEAFLQTAHDIRRILMSAEPSAGLEDRPTIELKIAANFDRFAEEEQKTLLEAIRKLLSLDQSEVTITGKKRGSVVLRLRIPRADVERLQQATRDGELRDFNVVDAEVVVDDEAVTPQTTTAGRPKVFIGSSVEGLVVAETIQLHLDHMCEVTVWSQGLFSLGSGTLESLTDILRDFDYAILVLSPDDFTQTRGSALFTPRDNVIFELGLFMGFLGRERTIMVFDRTADLKIPTDLAGVTTATFQPHSSGNLDAAMGAPCTRIKKHILTLGRRLPN